jgi:5'-nucleotidase
MCSVRRARLRVTLFAVAAQGMLNWPNMRILVTNDDGMFADGLWALAAELKRLGEVTVVCPDREQSAFGTAITLTQPLRVQKLRPVVPGVKAFAVQGTPGDSVILALDKLVEGKIDIVVSGINEGLNLGTDVLISGTVGAALQGYLRGFSSIALSIPGKDRHNLELAARLGRLLAERIGAYGLSSPLFLNANVPDCGTGSLAGTRITRLATASHIDTAQEGHDGKRGYFWLVRKRRPESRHAEGTDMAAIDSGFVSLTPLHLYDESGAAGASVPFCTDELCAGLSRDLGI